MVATAAWAAPGARTDHDPDLWHVAVAPGETKVLSLEQLDDLFRLEIIDASTRVWQPGMKDWLPLSVVAGLEDEEPAPVRAAPPPPPSRRPAPAPPRPPAQAPAATLQVPMGAQPIWALPAPAPAPLPAPAPQRAPAPASMRTVPITPVFTAPESIRPMVLSDVPYAPPKSGGGFGRFVIGLALVASVGVTLYRNDVLRQAARSVGQEPTYFRVEAALGSPGFGTPRAVEQLMASSLALPEPGLLPLPKTEAPARTTETVSATSTTTLASTTTATREETAKEKPASEKPASLESLVAAQVSAKKIAQPEPAARVRPRSGGASERPSAPVPEKSLGIKGSSNKFDPLNGKL